MINDYDVIVLEVHERAVRSRLVLLNDLIFCMLKKSPEVTRRELPSLNVWIIPGLCARLAGLRLLLQASKVVGEEGIRCSALLSPSV